MWLLPLNSRVIVAICRWAPLAFLTAARYIPFSLTCCLLIGTVEDEGLPPLL